MKILRFIVLSIALGLIVTPAWAADEAAIQDLQSDVTVAKSKAEKNSQAINSLMGGLPAVEARVAALESALSAADGAISQLQADLAAATARIGQLEADLNAEVAARQAADSGIEAAYTAADANLQAQIDVLGSVDIGALEGRIGSVEETLTCVTYDVVTKDLIFVGCNVHVRDGTGFTQSAMGLGNLIVGYNADAMAILDRSGSHNLILGDEQAYTGFAQLMTQYVGSGRDMSVVVGGNLSESISNNRTTNIGSDSSMNVGLDLNTTVGRNLTEFVSIDRSTSIGGMLTSSIDKDVAVTIGGNLAEVVAKDMAIQAGMNMTLVGADQLALTSGDASILMKKDGDIAVQGKAISIKGTGNVTIKGTLILEN